MLTITKKKVKRSLLSNKPIARKITNFRPMILTRHPSHKHLRSDLGLYRVRSVIRLGSTTVLTDAATLAGKRFEINPIQGIKNSASKLLMKHCFSAASIKTADWIPGNKTAEISAWAKDRYPIIAKPSQGSRGNGIKLLNTEQELTSFIANRNVSSYVFEKYYNYNREYRIHVTKDGCFYTCRKMLKSDVPKEKRHIRNDSTCSWFMEENKDFDKPINWDTIVAECVKALKAVGLDIAGFDVRVQSAKDGKERVRKDPDFIIIESNSACSHGTVTAIKYKEALIKLLNERVSKYGRS